MKQTSHTGVKDLKLLKTTKGLLSTFKANLCGKKSCDNKTKAEGNAMVKKKTMKSTAQNKFSSIWRGCLKAFIKKEVVLPKPYSKWGFLHEEKKHKNPFYCEKLHETKEGDLVDLFYCHQKRTTKFLLHTSYLCTELRITVTKASGKPTKNKVASTQGYL